MVKDMPKILVDGSSYLFRAYYAMPALTTQQGFPSGAIYGVVNMLKRLQKDYPKSEVIVVFDTKGKTFRHELYSEYKANRAVMPDDLAQQIDPLHEIIEAMGFPLIKVPGVEADDVIGTLALAFSKAGQQVLISTGDKDMAQLVNDQVTLVNTMTHQVLDIEGVQDKFGVRPDQIIDYLALIGDTSDNVPGIPKVGPKTAVKWLQQYKSLEGVIKNASAITGKVGENLRANLDQLELSQELVTIQCSVPLSSSISDYSMLPANVSALKHWYDKLEFSTWLKELTTKTSGEEPVIDEVESLQDYEVVLNEAACLQWIKKIEATSVFALDVETTSLDDMSAELVGISLAVAPGEAAYIPLMHDYSEAPSQLDTQWVLEQLRPILQDPSRCVVGHNIKYDWKVLCRYGLEIIARCDDTLLQSYVLHNVTVRHDMDTLAEKFLGHQTMTYESVAGKGVKQKTFNQISLDVAAPYAAEDADITLQLFMKFDQALHDEPSLRSVYDTIEQPLLLILTRMEYHGVLLDTQLLSLQSKDLSDHIERLEQEAYRLAGAPFNLASPKQLQEVLFEKLQLPIIKKTPKGQPSTAEAVLQELATDYPLPHVIVQYRSLAKLKSTYTDKLPQQVNSQTGRVHTHYNQAVTSTGRLSSNNPNLQNIPVRTEEGRRIRQAFIAPEGKVIVAADYSQVELRIMAHASKDQGMIQAFEQGLDIHQSTAAEVFGVPVESVTAEQRRHAKAINFGLLYGMSAFGLSKQLNVDRQAAQLYIDAYFDRYPAVLQYMESARQQAADQGYVTTLLGRRLVIPEINASNVMRRKAAERAAINAPLQGTAADLIKLAMINLQQLLLEQQLEMTLIMQVHDELVFEVKKSDQDAAVALIRQSMEQVMSLSIPLIVDIGVGSNWEVAH